MTSSLADFAPLFAEQPELWANPAAGLVVSLSVIISGIGVAVIAWGTYSSVLRLIASETAAARGLLPKADGVTDRLVFATYLLPGLDFLTAGSVVKTLAVPDWQQAALVASLVFARTLVGLGLKWGLAPAAGLPAPSPVSGQLAAPTAPAEGAGTAIEDAAPAGARTVP